MIHLCVILRWRTKRKCSAFTSYHFAVLQVIFFKFLCSTYSLQSGNILSSFYPHNRVKLSNMIVALGKNFCFPRGNRTWNWSTYCTTKYKTTISLLLIDFCFQRKHLFLQPTYRYFWYRLYSTSAFIILHRYLFAQRWYNSVLLKVQFTLCNKESDISKTIVQKCLI